MSEEKMTILCATLAFLVGAFLFHDCLSGSDKQRHELKVLCAQSRGVWEYGAGKMPAKEPCE